VKCVIAPVILIKRLEIERILSCLLSAMRRKKKGGQGTYPGRDKASARGKHIKRRQECLLRETRKNIMKKEKSKRQLLGLLLVLLF